MSQYTTKKFLRTLKPEVYELAAELVKKSHQSRFSGVVDECFSCHAVAKAASDSGGVATDYNLPYAGFFSPKTDAEEKAHPYWNKGLNTYTRLPGRTFRRHKAERINALLMMAAIVRQAKKKSQG